MHTADQQAEKDFPGSPLLSGACTATEILQFIKKHKCCDVAFYGHRGGRANQGGIATDCGSGYQRILPNPGLEYAIREEFRKNNCQCPKVKITACGESDRNSAEWPIFETTCLQMANRLECMLIRSKGYSCLFGTGGDVIWHSDPGGSEGPIPAPSSDTRIDPIPW